MSDVYKPCISIGNLADRPATPEDKSDVYIARDLVPPVIYICDESMQWIAAGESGGGAGSDLYLHQNYYKGVLK